MVELCRKADKKSNMTRGVKLAGIILIFTLVFSFSPVLSQTDDDVYGACKPKSQQDKVITVAKGKMGKGAGYFGFGGAWCTQYVNWTMKKAGLSNGKNYPKAGLGSSRDFAVHYAKKGAYTAIYKASSVGYKTKVNKNYIPKKGDIAIFARGVGGNIHHVGFVASVTKDSKGYAKKVQIVHGNWGNKVSLTSHNMYGSTWGTTLVGYCTPSYSLNVSLNPEGGSLNKKNISVVKGKKFGSMPKPSRSGYEFTGWYMTKDGNKKVTSNSKVGKSESFELHAHWEKIPTTVETPDNNSNE